MSERIVIVGAGRMGLALGAALRGSGQVEDLLYMGRALQPPPHALFDAAGSVPAALYLPGPAPLPEQTTLVVLAVPDSAIAAVAFDLSRAGPAPAGCVAVHLSGALSADVLEPLHAVGYATGTLHPMQSVADPRITEDALTGIAFAISGEPAALRAARRIVNLLDGVAVVIPSQQRPLYHAAATLASSGIVVLAAAAGRWLEQVGLSREEAQAALLPLMRGTLDNVQRIGLAAGLTGPVARGDVDTVRLHLSRLSGRDRTLYCALGREALLVARAAGLDAQKAAAIDALLGSH